MYNNIHNASGVIDLQLNILRQQLEEELQSAQTEQERNSIINNALRKFFMCVGKPLTTLRYAEYGHPPYIDDYNDTAREIVDDISIVYSELEYIGDAISEAFNYSQNEKTKLKNRINTISSMATDFNLISNEGDENVVYFKESFNGYNNVDPSVSAGTMANISTSEGVATLARQDSVNCNDNAVIKSVSGNGQAGNYHIAKRTEISTEDGDKLITAKYQSNEGAHDDPSAIIDKRPDTWFEYQMVNASENLKAVTNGYDIDWTKGKEYNDKLRLRIVIDLGKVQDINWIDINPYIPEKSNGKVYIYSLKTSADGIDYTSVKDGVTVLQSEINRVSHTYDKDKIFVGNIYSNDKVSSQGTFWFPPRNARYIEVVIDQDQSYPETIGHTYYEKVNTRSEQEQRVRVPSTDVPEGVVAGEPGKYPLDKDQYIIKGIGLMDGWRYCIGIKDIGIYSHKFVQKSEIITKPFVTDKPMKTIMLYSNEVIPDVFLQDLMSANEWIQYYISVDDIHWHRIAPMHHQSLGRTDFPPKVYRINSKEVIEDRIEHPQYGYIYTNNDVKSIRLKIVLSRPTEITNTESYTPILEDYSLRILLEDSFLDPGGLL